MVDTGDLKSPGHCDRAGSSPAPGTTNIWSHRQAVRPQPAKLLSPVQIRVAPPLYINWVLSFSGKILFLQMSGDVRVVECAGLENR